MGRAFLFALLSAIMRICGFNPSDFSLSTPGRLIIDVTHFRPFLSSLLHIIATGVYRAIWHCATRADFARVRRGPCRLYLTESGPGRVVSGVGDEVGGAGEVCNGISHGWNAAAF